MQEVTAIVPSELVVTGSAGKQLSAFTTVDNVDVHFISFKS